MADHEATVEVDVKLKTFKVSGSEKFIERMLEVLPGLLPTSTDSGDVDDEDNDLDRGEGSGGGSLDDFVAKSAITNNTSGERKVTAFVYYLTKVAKSSHATAAQIESCFDQTGLKTPEGLDRIINNARSRSKTIRSVAPGKYEVTTKGNNIVKAMMKAS
jgi:hypothetical protein